MNLLKILLALLASIFTPKPAQSHRTSGLKPDRPDSRDYLYKSPLDWLRVKLPAEVDRRPEFFPVYDQLALGSCSMNASEAHVRFVHKKLYGDDTPLSRLFGYWNVRDLEGTVNEDSGATLRDAIKAIDQFGLCAEGLCPYVIENFKNKPSAEAYAEGLTREISSFHRILTLNDMKTCLAEGYPFILGFQVFEPFESDEVARTGMLAMPASADRNLGGHAVLAVGYSDRLQCLICRNSWGPDWGDKGYFYMPYAYAQNAQLTNDMWTIRK